MRCWHNTCSCFPVCLFPVVQLLCCARWEQVVEHENVIRVDEPVLKTVKLGLGEALGVSQGPSLVDGMARDGVTYSQAA